jgi:hypothetical protein
LSSSIFGPAADASPRSSRGEPVEGALDDHLALELAYRGEDVEDEATADAGRVDALVQHDEVDLPLAEHLSEVEQVPDRAAEPVQAGDDDLIAGAQVLEHRVELRAPSQLAGDLVDEDPFAAGSGSASD